MTTRCSSIGRTALLLSVTAGFMGLFRRQDSFSRVGEIKSSRQDKLLSTWSALGLSQGVIAVWVTVLGTGHKVFSILACHCVLLITNFD